MRTIKSIGLCLLCVLFGCSSPPHQQEDKTPTGTTEEADTGSSDAAFDAPPVNNTGGVDANIGNGSCSSEFPVSTISFTSQFGANTTQTAALRGCCTDHPYLYTVSVQYANISYRPSEGAGDCVGLAQLDGTDYFCCVSPICSSYMDVLGCTMPDGSGKGSTIACQQGATIPPPCQEYGTQIYCCN